MSKREKLKTARRWYNRKRWRVIRRRVLLANPYCVVCLAKGNKRFADEIDHKNPVDETTTEMDFYKQENLQGLCKACHIAKTKAENPSLATPNRANPSGRITDPNSPLYEPPATNTAPVRTAQAPASKLSEAKGDGT